MTAVITEPCLVPVMSDEVYHGDPVEGGSLSSSGAKTLLKSPAHYQWSRAHRVEKSTYDVGHAVHAKVLGVGMQAVVIPDSVLASNGAASTAEAKKFIAEARLAGQVPLKADVMAEVDAMVESVLSHPDARAVFERPGVAESSAFAPDPETGVWMRARPDFLPDRTERRTIIGDLKTAVSADPRDFDRTAADYGYDVQSVFYPEVVRNVRGDDDVAFVFVIVEKTAPYLVSVCELVDDFPRVGRSKMRRALERFRECRETGEWPGYDRGVHGVSPPRWHVINEEIESLT